MRSRRCSPATGSLEAVEDAPAGPWLAAFIGGIDPAVLSEWELPAYLRACHKLAAWTAAQLTEGVAQLASRPGGFGADKEVALALREPVGAAQRRIHRALRLRRLPVTRERFGRGELDQQQADALVDATAGVNDGELLAAVEQKVVEPGNAGSRTASELRRAARQTLDRLDPAGAQDRARAARDQADVALLPGEDGTASVLMSSAPVEDALTVKTAVDAYAVTAKQTGDPRRIGVLRAEALTRFCTDYLTGTTSGSSAPRAGGRPIEIGIVVDLPTALGRAELPAEIPGHGIVPRDVIADMIRTELPKLRLLVIDPDSGRLLHRASGTYRPTAEQVAQVRATYPFSVGPGSHVTADRTDTDHAVPYPEGETVIGNLIPNDRAWHNGHTKKQLSVTVDHDWHRHLDQRARPITHRHPTRLPNRNIAPGTNRTRHLSPGNGPSKTTRRRSEPALHSLNLRTSVAGVPERCP